MRNVEIRGPLLLASLCMAALAGCGQSYEGPERGAVQGTVTFDGKPVQKGTIEFVPAEGTAGPSAGAEINDGKYRIEEAGGPVLGKYLVKVHWYQPTGRTIDSGSLGKTPEVAESIPAKFNEKTTLEREIKSGENTFDFELTSS